VYDAASLEMTTFSLRPWSGFVRCTPSVDDDPVAVRADDESRVPLADVDEVQFDLLGEGR
jgi:hypothetical protein